MFELQEKFALQRLRKKIRDHRLGGTIFNRHVAGFHLVSGKKSSSKRTLALNIRYFFITDQVESGNVSIEYCPTKSMITDFFTKPLQGELFLKFKGFVKKSAIIDLVGQYSIETLPDSTWSVMKK